MADADEVSEDRGFKELFTAYPFETVEVFVPELLAQRGRPASVEAIQQETPLPDLGDPSRFLDVALRCTWADGYTAIIVLVEHWSEARKVDLDRVLWYYAALRLKHPGTEVVPVVLVTDRSVREVPDRLVSAPLRRPMLDFRVQVVRIGPADLPRLRSLQAQNRVAAMLQALAIANAMDAALASVQALVASPGPLDDIRRFLPLALRLAKLSDDDEPRFRRRMREDPTMGNLLDDIKTEGRAEGRAEGARATVAAIRRLVTKGVMPVDAARAEIEELIASQAIPEAIGREALGLLG
jgi:hypothetical protein